MSSSRIWIIGGSVVILAILVFGWIVGVSPELSAVRSADAQLTQAKAQNAQEVVNLAALKKKYEQIDTLQAQLATVQSSIPATEEMSGLLTNLVGAEGASGVVISSFTPGDARVYTPAVAATPAATTTPDPTATATAAPTPSPSPSATTPATTGTAATAGGVAPTQASDVALVSTGNFIGIPIALQVKGSVDQVDAFVAALRAMNRLFLVTKFSAGGVGDSAGGTVNGFAYVLPDTTAK